MFRCKNCSKKENTRLRKVNYYKMKMDLGLIADIDGKSYLMQPQYKDLIANGFSLKEIDTMEEKYGNYDCRAILEPFEKSDSGYISHIVFAKRIYW